MALTRYEGISAGRTACALVNRCYDLRSILPAFVRRGRVDSGQAFFLLRAAWDGVKHGFGQFFVRFLVMLYLMEIYDIGFFDWVLLTHSNFFPPFLPGAQGHHRPAPIWVYPEGACSAFYSLPPHQRCDRVGMYAFLMRKSAGADSAPALFLHNVSVRCAFRRLTSRSMHSHTSGKRSLISALVKRSTATPRSPNDAVRLASLCQNASS